MFRLHPQQFLQRFSCLLLIVLQHVETGKVEIRLIEVWSGLNASLELRFRTCIIVGSNKENAEVVQRLGITRTQIDCLLQIVRGRLRLSLLSVKHPEAIVSLRIIGLNLERAIQKRLCLVERALPAIKISQVEQGDRVVRPLTQ